MGRFPPHFSVVTVDYWHVGTSLLYDTSLDRMLQILSEGGLHLEDQKRKIKSDEGAGSSR